MVGCEVSVRNKHDQYFTPPELTRAMLERLCRVYPGEHGRERGRPAWHVLEPTAGDLWIANEIREYFGALTTVDIDPAMPVDHPGVDFLDPRFGGEYDAVIGNPPFTLAAPIVRKALTMAPKVIMLLRITFLEGCEADPRSARLDLLQQLSAVIVVPRPKFIKGAGQTDSTTCAWFIWDHGWDGPAFDWVSQAEIARHLGQCSLLDEVAG